jgi:hypothetical protein
LRNIFVQNQCGLNGERHSRVHRPRKIDDINQAGNHQPVKHRGEGHRDNIVVVLYQACINDFDLLWYRVRIQRVGYKTDIFRPALL